jgi:methylmalonyl-CoA mutase
MQENLFKDFDKVSDKEWEQKIIADLKGKSIEDLNWQLKEDFVLKPYYTATDTEKIDFPILRTNNPDWQIGEKIDVIDFKEANKRVLEVLMKGVTAPIFHFYSLPSQDEFNQVFENVGIEFIATHFSFDIDGIDYLAFYNLWTQLLVDRNLDSTFACFDFDAKLLNEDDNLENMAIIVANNEDFAQETIHINCKAFHTNETNSSLELESCISKAKSYFDFFIEKGIDAKKIAQQTYFTICVGKSYLIEIAKIRALKLLWVELLATYNVEASLPFIKVAFAPNAYGESIDDNLINGTSLCMSAVLGGANQIVVTPTADTEKGNRLARNTQLILKHESGFNQVADPMAGSYYIEVLTAMFLKNVSKELKF